MPIIHLETLIHAKIDVVFDLSRSIDLHQVSTANTEERAVGGRLSGLMELGESVTWQARHFGIVQTLTSEITAFEKPVYFVDEMVQGAFKAFKHEHLFVSRDQITLMTDIFNYTSPFGIFGKVADTLFLKRYMEKFLMQRNMVIKEYAENPVKID